MYWRENIYIDEYEIMPQYLMSLGLNPDWQLLFTAIPENICAALKTFDSAFSLRHVQMLTALQTRDLYQIKGKKIPSIQFQWTDALFHRVSALSQAYILFHSDTSFIYWVALMLTGMCLILFDFALVNFRSFA